MWHVAMNAANTQCLSASIMVRCQKYNEKCKEEME